MANNNVDTFILAIKEKDIKSSSFVKVRLVI